MKAKEVIGKIFKNKIGRTVSLVLIAAIVATTIIICINKYKPDIVVEPMIVTLQKTSELTTAKLNFRGLAEYEDTGIKFLNRSDYKMLFKATARIGIDLKEVEIDKKIVNKTIIVKIPKSEILDVKIHTGKDDIQFFDEKFSLFNFNEKEDQNAALDLAEKAAMKEIKEMGNLEMADDQAENLIKGILANAVPDGYKIEVKQK